MAPSAVGSDLPCEAPRQLNLRRNSMTLSTALSAGSERFAGVVVVAAAAA